MNSKAEFNRSAVPRISTKLGDSDYQKYDKEAQEEKKRNEEIDIVIRTMRKERNVERRPVAPEQASKRRKINEQEYSECRPIWGRPSEKAHGDKRKNTKENGPELKKVRMEEKEKMPPCSPGERGKGDEAPPYCNKSLGDTEDDEKELEELAKKYHTDDRFYNMKEINERRRLEFEEKGKVENERKSKAEMLINTWALARLCQEIITESEGEWNDRTAEMESNIEKIKAANEKKVRLEIVKEKKAAIEMKRKQQRIDIMIDELSVKEVEE